MQKKQSLLGEEIKGDLWRRIIKEKIKNQLCTIDNIIELNCDDSEFLKQCVDNVKHYDMDNREGVAARFYFKKLFGEKFSRHDDENPINSFLNYGYSIVRSSFSRAICIYGLNPCFGVFHKNEGNSFNLADDLMEIYRPIVDEFVFKKYKDLESLDRSSKMEMVNLLNHYIMMNNEKINIATSIERFVVSFIKAIETNNSEYLSFPLIKIVEEYEL